MSLTQRTVTSVGWKSVSSSLRVVILFGRFVLLSRILPKETFGIYGGALAVIGFSSAFFAMGLSGAFIHRSAENVDEEETAAVHFTLTLLLIPLWWLFLIAFAYLSLDGISRIALIVAACTSAIRATTHTPMLILTRRVVHRRLALMEVIIDVGTTISSVTIALMGGGLWALLSTNIVGACVPVFMLYIWKPVWKPQILWKKSLVHYFLRFGFVNMWLGVLGNTLDKGDDLFTNFHLGTMAMSDYSRAYTFASYPRRILAQPVSSIASGTYAELKGQRLLLSRAFVQINGMLIRTGFLLGGTLALIAPEFVRILLGDTWVSFVPAYRLMLLFTLLDPLKVTVGSLFVAIDQQGDAIKARIIQLVVLCTGLLLMGTQWGIIGVALAVDLMLVVGLAILFWQVRRYVDYSLRQLFLVPTVALVISMGLGRVAITLPGVIGSDWRTGLVKLFTFVPLYILILILFEWKKIGQMVAIVRPMRQPEIDKNQTD